MPCLLLGLTEYWSSTWSEGVFSIEQRIILGTRWLIASTCAGMVSLLHYQVRRWHILDSVRLNYSFSWMSCSLLLLLLHLLLLASFHNQLFEIKLTAFSRCRPLKLRMIFNLWGRWLGNICSMNDRCWDRDVRKLWCRRLRQINRSCKGKWSLQHVWYKAFSFLKCNGDWACR